MLVETRESCSGVRSQFPTVGGAGVWEVGAVGAGADGALEVLSELGVVLLDPAHRLAYRPCDTGSSALGRRSGSSAAATEAHGTRQLADEEVSFCVCLFLADVIAVGPCLFDVVVDFGEATPIGGLGFGVEHLAGVAEREVRGGGVVVGGDRVARFSRGKVEHVELSPGMSEQPGEVTHPFAIRQVHGAARERH